MKFDQQQFETTWQNFSPYHEKLKLSAYFFDNIPSTNQKLWELISAGQALPLVAIASTQSAGRGQWGRTWQSPSGGLYLSLALATQMSAQNAPHLTLCSAWGIATALRSKSIPVALKWPNDLILEGRKLGGIKAETRIQQGQITQAVIGIGINWTNPVPEIGINLQSFLKKQTLISSIESLEILATIAIHGVLSGYQRYIQQGIEGLLPSYLELLDNLGRSVVVNGCPGVIVGVTPLGKLRVRLRSPGAITEIYLEPGQISLGYQHNRDD